MLIKKSVTLCCNQTLYVHESSKFQKFLRISANFCKFFSHLNKKSFVLDYTGYIVFVGQEEISTNNGNLYFDIQMKVGVDHFIVIRVMKNNNSSINPEMFHSKRVGKIPVTLSKVKTTASGTKFFNSYFGCAIVENPSGVKFKFDEKNSISIKDIKMKEGGYFCHCSFNKMDQ